VMLLERVPVPRVTGKRDAPEATDNNTFNVNPWYLCRRYDWCVGKEAFLQ